VQGEWLGVARARAWGLGRCAWEREARNAAGRAILLARQGAGRTAKWAAAWATSEVSQAAADVVHGPRGESAGGRDTVRSWATRLRGPRQGAGRVDLKAKVGR
jgi:hypothetical protein